jgi:LEA14-like dessication related protein
MAETSVKSYKKTGIMLGILGVVGFAAYKLIPKAKTLFKAAQTGGRLNVQLSKISFKKPFGVIFRIINPTNGELSVSSVAGNVVANGNDIATYSLTNEIKIEANSQQEIKVPLKINPVEFLSIVAQIGLIIFNAKQSGADPKEISKKVMAYFKSIRLKITGTINAAGIPITIDKKIYN